MALLFCLEHSTRSDGLGKSPASPAEGRRGSKTGATIVKRVELVELIAAPPAPVGTTPRFTLRVGKPGIEVGYDFDSGPLRRPVGALAC